MTKTLLVLFVFLNLTCQDAPSSKANTPLSIKPNNKTDTMIFYSETELKQLWDTLCQKKGCLTGGQYIHEGKWGGEGCVLTLDKKWGEFLFQTDKQSLGTFLIQQLKDKTNTRVHTCPHHLANKGELSLYCLQGVLKKNFFDLSKEKALSDRDLYKKYGSEQEWIWHIQSTKYEVELLQKLWQEELGKQINH